MATSEESMDEKQEGWDDIQDTGFISLSCFWVTQMTHQDNLFYPTANFSLFYDVYVALTISCEGKVLELSYENNLHKIS